MKAATLLIVCLLCLSGPVLADSRESYRGRHSPEIFYVEGRVIRAEPIYESRWFPSSRPRDDLEHYHETCRVREVEVYRSSSSATPAAAILGGVIGAHVGATAGHSAESAVVGAIAGGVIGGALGSEIDRDNSSVHYRTEHDCDRHYRRKERVLIGYDVRYRYNGREFSMRTAEHPGRYVELRVELQPAVR